MLSEGKLCKDLLLSQIIENENDNFNTISASATLLQCLIKMKRTVLFYHFIEFKFSTCYRRYKWY